MRKILNHNICISALRLFVVAVALICLTVTATSCRSTGNVTTQVNTVYVHDTTEVVKYVHDTTRIVNVKLDSVDRFVERNVYVDTNGVVHEKEVERLTRFIFLQDEYHQSVVSYYESKLKMMEKRVKELESKKQVEVERELSWFQKTMIGLGFVFILVVVVRVAIFLYRKK